MTKNPRIRSKKSSLNGFLKKPNHGLIEFPISNIPWNLCICSLKIDAKHFILNALRGNQNVSIKWPTSYLKNSMHINSDLKVSL